MGFLFILSIIPVRFLDERSSIPAPTEIIQHKKDRNQFKEKRKEWMDNMHRAGPGVDWEKIDQRSRQIKIDQKTKNRKTQLSENGPKLSGPLPIFWD